jgi:hypothetical protein
MVALAIVCSVCDGPLAVDPCPGEEECAKQFLVQKGRAHQHYHCEKCGYAPFVVSIFKSERGDSLLVTSAGRIPPR